MELTEVILDERPSIEKLSNKPTGLAYLTRKQALTINSCCFCGNVALDFRSEAYRAEYLESALCQQCQDELFQE